MPVGQTDPSVAPANPQQVATVDTRRSDPMAKCDPSVKAGICSANTVPLPPPPRAHGPMDPKIVARNLLKSATLGIERDRLSSYSRLDDFWKQSRPEVRRAMLANPDFKPIVDGAARAFISACFKDNNPTAGDQALHYIYGLAKDSDPGLATALVISAARIFEEDHAVFTRDDKMLESDQTYVEGLNLLIDRSEPGAVQAIESLTARAKRIYVADRR